MRIERGDHYEPIWHFTKAELTALLSHMSTDTTRLRLCGLALDIEHGRAYATDGHRAIVCETVFERESGALVLVPRNAIEHAMRLPGKANDEISLTPRHGKIVVRRVGTEMVRDLSTAIPPPIDFLKTNLNETGERCKSQAFCGDYLADLGNVVKACPKWYTADTRKPTRHTPSVDITYGVTELDPWVATIRSPGNATTWTIYLMPCRL